MHYFVLVLLCSIFGFEGGHGQGVTSDNYCYPGFTQHGSTCYRYIKLKVNWADAWTYCSTMGAHLVTIKTPDANIILTDIVRNYTKGENDSRIERTWTAGTNIQGDLQWQNTRVPVTYTSWARGEPYLEAPDDVYCVMKFRNAWYADDCDNERRFMCEAEIDGLVAPQLDGQKRPSSTTTKPDIPQIG